MARLDLHTHSIRSDGVREPAWVVERAAANGAELIALTDHDTLDGVAEAISAGRRCGIRVIPGVELGVHADQLGEVHVLGHFPQADGADAPALRDLQHQLAAYRQERRSRAQQILDRLADLGVRLDPRRVAAIAASDGGAETSVGRPHIARAMVEAGHADSVADAFNRFLRNSGPAYVARRVLGLSESIEVIQQAGGLATLAHPTRYDQPDLAIDAFARAGGDGLEVYYRRDPPDLIAEGEAQAARYGLFLTVGSDWHGLHDDECEPASVEAPDQAVDRFFRLCDQPAPSQTATG